MCSTVFKTVAFNRSATHPEASKLYMSFLFNERQIVTNSENFLLNPDDWSEELMFYMAKLDGLELTEQHLAVIKAVRLYYAKYDTTPPMRRLIAFLKKEGHAELGSSVALARLFPAGAAKSAAKYAGLPKPVKCI